jgi:Cys-tRNA(Pro)/Cys-tRNA(Cys) deacylase
MANKLNSMRLLESHNVPYEVFNYDPSIHDADEVGAKIGVPAAQVYKTLVVERANTSSKPILVMIAADRHLDLKKLAASIGEKKVSMAAHADAEKHTGLKVGGIGALALVHKKWDVYLDRAAANLDSICVSGGQRGTNLRVAVADLIRVLNAKVVEATEAPQGG